jgi:hypothetical protein
MTQATAEEVWRVLEQTGLRPIYDAVCSEWLPFVEKKFAWLPPDALGELMRASGKFESPQDLLEPMCKFMAMVYVGRRIGNLQIEFKHPDETGATVTTEGTVTMLSELLTVLSNAVGQRSAAQIFRKLEKVVDRAIGHGGSKAR